MFDIDALVGECRAAMERPDPPEQLIADIVGRAIARPDWFESLFGTPPNDGPRILYRSPDLTVYCSASLPGSRVPPHDHKLWAVAGISRGLEDNLLFVREDEDRIRRDRIITVEKGHVLAMGVDDIHASRYPGGGMTASLHVYGGDLFGAPRSIWDDNGVNRRDADIVPLGSVEETQRHVDENIRGLRREP